MRWQTARSGTEATGAQTSGNRPGVWVFLALALAGLGPLGSAREGPTAPKTQSPATAPTGVMSVTLAGVPPPAQASALPPGFSEVDLVCGTAEALSAREFGAQGAQRAAPLVQRLRAAYAEMAQEKRFASLPCALAPELSGHGGTPRHYYLYVPEDYHPERKYTLLLFLHGGGGNFLFGFHGAVSEARKRKLILACPTYGNGEWWTPEGGTFALKVVDEIASRYPIDPAAVLIAGASNGASGAWAISEQHRERFAAVISISGAFGGPNAVKASQGPPLYIVHGAKDTVIPVGLSRQAFEALKARKGTVYNEIAEGGHLVALEQPEIGLPAALDWFARLKEGPPAAKKNEREN